MGTSGNTTRRVAVPRCHYGIGISVVALSAIILFALNARASDFGTIASALGLYSAGLLGVFSILTSWRSTIITRKHRYQQVEDKWRKVIDRSVKSALHGSSLSFLLMLFGITVPAVKTQLASLLDIDFYSFLARCASAVAISSIVMLGLISLQIVRDVTGVYAWNNVVEEQDAIVQAQRDAIDGLK